MTYSFFFSYRSHLQTLGTSFDSEMLQALHGSYQNQSDPQQPGFWSSIGRQQQPNMDERMETLLPTFATAKRRCRLGGDGPFVLIGSSNEEYQDEKQKRGK